MKSVDNLWPLLKEYNSVNVTKKFFSDLVYDVTEDYRTNKNKKYDVKKTVEKLINDDILWQRLNDAVWVNLVEIKEAKKYDL